MVERICDDCSTSKHHVTPFTFTPEEGEVMICRECYRIRKD